jgi:hypothetical protein
MGAIAEFTFSIRDIDLKKFVDFESVFRNSKPGSKVHFIKEVSENLIDQLKTKGRLPFPILDFTDLVEQVCKDNQVEIGKRFIREVVKSHVKSRNDVVLRYRSERQVYIDIKGG